MEKHIQKLWIGVKRYWIIAVLFLLTGSTQLSGLEKQELKKEVGVWVNKAKRFEFLFARTLHTKTIDSIKYKTDLISKDRIILSLKNNDAIKYYPGKREIKYIKEPSKPIDSLAIYNKIYAQKVNSALHGVKEIKVK